MDARKNFKGMASSFEKRLTNAMFKRKAWELHGFLDSFRKDNQILKDETKKRKTYFKRLLI